MARVLAILAAAFAFSLTASWWDNDVVDTAVWHSFGVIAAVTMWIGVARRPTVRGPWVWIALGLTAWVGGDIAWDILSWEEELSEVSLVDAFYITGYACFFVGLLAFVRAAVGALSREAAIDGLILAVATGLVFAVTLVRPADDPSSAAYTGVSLAYPLFAIALLAAVAWLRLHPERRTLPAGTGVLTVAVLLLVALEPVTAWYWVTEPDIDVLPTLDRLFQVAFAIMVLAVYRTGEHEHWPRRHGLHPLRMLMLGAALAAAPLTMLLVEGSETVAVIAAAIVSVLVLVRFAALSRERERAQELLAHQATHDPLTRLGNRSLLYEAVDDFSHGGDRRKGEGLALLYLDVDNFKTINDTHGHAVGDAFLAELADRIRTSLRPNDVPTRLGGDEFVILCPGATGVDGARVVADRLTELMREPVQIGDLSLTTTLSIGVASSQDAGDGLDDLLRAADEALYTAKRDGRNATVAFEGEPTAVG